MLKNFHLLKFVGLHVENELVGKHTYIHKNPVCVCVYVRKTPESGSLVVLFTRQCRLLLNEYGLSISLLRSSTLEYAHTHTHTGLLCIYVYLLIQ